MKTITLTFDVGTRRVSPSRNLNFVAGDAVELNVKILEDGVARLLAEGEEIAFGAVNAEDLDGGTLVLVPFADFTEGVDEDAGYTALVETASAELLAALADSAELALTGEMRFINTDGGENTSNKISLTAVRDYLRPGEETPTPGETPEAWLTARAVRFDSTAQTLDATQRDRVADRIGHSATGADKGVLLRKTGSIAGYADNGSSLAPPPDLVVAFQTGTGTFTLTKNGVDTVFTFDTTDPVNGSVWVDTSAIASDPDMAIAAKAAIEANVSGTTVVRSTATLTISHNSSGSSASLAGVQSGSVISSVTGGGSGTDAVAPSGGGPVSATVIAAATGKAVKLVRVLVKASAGLALRLTAGSVTFSRTITSGTWIDVTGDNSEALSALFSTGGQSGSALVLDFPSLAPEGSTLSYLIFAEQV